MVPKLRGHDIARHPISVRPLRRAAPHGHHGAAEGGQRGALRHRQHRRDPHADAAATHLRESDADATQTLGTGTVNSIIIYWY